jgi:heme-degrading monooxygenase HmoA
MHARVITAQVHYDKLGEASRLYQEGLVPIARRLSGFKGSLWLADDHTGKSLILLFWESEAELKAGEINEAFQQQFRQVASSFVSTPMRESYRVEVQPELEERQTVD